MSKIQAALRAQIEGKNRPFICIKGLIEAMVNNDAGCTFIEVANILGSTIEKNFKSIKTLCYYRSKNNDGYFEFIKFIDFYKASHNYKNAQKSNFGNLVHILNKKIFNERDDIFLRDYGVRRSEFSKLLEELGVFIDLSAEIKSRENHLLLIADNLPAHELINTAATGGVTGKRKGKVAENLPLEKAETMRFVTGVSSPDLLLFPIIVPCGTIHTWRLKTPPARMPGYRGLLYKFLQDAHVSGGPCPKAQQFLDALKLASPPGFKVIQAISRDELEYEINTGKKKLATAKQIQAVLKDLLAE